MPIYEYRCLSCYKISEFLIKISDKSDVPDCKYCNDPDMERVISKFALGHSPKGGPNGRALEYYKDPQNIGRNVESTFSRYGMDVPESVKDTIKSAREGDIPKRFNQ